MNKSVGKKICCVILITYAHVVSAPIRPVSPRDIEGTVLSVEDRELCSNLGRAEGICESRPGYEVVILDAAVAWSDTGDFYGDSSDVGNFDTLRLYLRSENDPKEYEGERITIYGYDLLGDEYSLYPDFDSLKVSSQNSTYKDMRKPVSKTYHINRIKGRDYFTLNGRSATKIRSKGVYILRRTAVVDNPDRCIFLEKRSER